VTAAHEPPRRGVSTPRNRDRFRGKSYSIRHRFGEPWMRPTPSPISETTATPRERSDGRMAPGIGHSAVISDAPVRLPDFTGA
jgi:hypothetical protein